MPENINIDAHKNEMEVVVVFQVLCVCDFPALAATRACIIDYVNNNCKNTKDNKSLCAPHTTIILHRSEV